MSKQTITPKETFIDYFLSDRKEFLKVKIGCKLVKQFEGKDTTLSDFDIHFDQKVIETFEWLGGYLNDIDFSDWHRTKIEIDDALSRYYHNLERREHTEPISNPSDRINDAIKRAKVIINDLSLAKDRTIYSEDGKEYTDGYGEIREVAPTAIDRVLLGNLLDKYIHDLKTKSFKIAHHGKYYVNYRVSKTELGKVLRNIRKRNNLKKASTPEKVLKDTI